MITDAGAYICLRSDNCLLQRTAPPPLNGALDATANVLEIVNVLSIRAKLAGEDGWVSAEEYD